MLLKDQFGRFILHLERIGLHSKTIKEYRRFLNSVLMSAVGELEIEQIRLTHVDRIIEYGREHGAWGSQRAVSCFRVLWHFLEDDNFSLPFSYVRIKVPSDPPASKMINYLEPEEFEKLVNVLPLNGMKGLRLRALLELMISTGVRIGEALSIDKIDIDWEKKQIIVRNNKTKAIEKVFLTDRAIYWLQKYLAHSFHKQSYLFDGPHGRLDYPTAKNHLNLLAPRANLKKRVHFHMIRKSFCTWLLNHGTDVKSVQHLARHKSERTTLKYYAGFNIERAREKHRAVLNKTLSYFSTEVVCETK